MFGKNQSGAEENSSGPAKYHSAYEIIGPVMIGPSSSHTAGAVRIGNVANQLLNEQPLFAKFSLMGSFAKTYQGHGTDLALLAGVMGFTTTDDRIPDAKECAEETGLQYEFTNRVLGSYHPNSVLVELKGQTRKVKVLASSLGGGKIEVQELNDYPLKFSGERPALIIFHTDKKGVIADLLGILSKKGINIARMANERFAIGGPAITICEIDTQVGEEMLAELKRDVPIIDDILLVETE
nr:L-serine ammonia-lyase, iron-sulfur-dependent subunit beta [Sporosarcina cascadiensis]